MPASGPFQSLHADADFNSVPPPAVYIVDGHRLSGYRPTTQTLVCSIFVRCLYKRSSLSTGVSAVPRPYDQAGAI